MVITLPALVIENLSVQFGQATAVHRVSVQVELASVTGITGNNGAGKSTLMHAIMGLAKLKQGRVELFGRDVSKWSSRRMARAGVALVPEGRHVFADQTVDDNLRLGFLPRKGISVADARRAALNLFPELYDHAGRTAGALSGGQQQMVAVARALMSSPQLLLLDEPFLGLAPVIVDRLREGIRQLARHGVTVLVSDSAALRMLEFCDYNYVMRVGEIAAQGTSQELRQVEDLQSLLMGGG